MLNMRQAGAIFILIMFATCYNRRLRNIRMEGEWVARKWDMSSLERNFNSSSTIVASPKRLPAFDSSRGENFSRTLHYRSSKIGVEIIVRLQHSKYIFFESSRSLSIVYRFEVSILGNYRELEGQSLERKERKEKSRRMARVEQRGLGLDFVKMQPDRDENGSTQSLLFFFFFFVTNYIQFWTNILIPEPELYRRLLTHPDAATYYS